MRDIIKVFTVDDDLTLLTEAACPDKDDLWRKKLARFPPVAAATSSELSMAIVAEAPEAIDIVHSRHGETLRYCGLPFARVRLLLGREKVWFGIDRAHRAHDDHPGNGSDGHCAYECGPHFAEYLRHERRCCAPRQEEQQ